MSLHLNRAATAAAFACCLWLAACSRGPDLAADAPDYRELAVVLQARLAPCLNQPGFVPPWPRTGWRSDRKPVDYAHPTPIASTAATAGSAGVAAVHYLMHIGDGGFAVYVSQVAGAPPSAAAASAPGGVPAMPVQEVWGPLPFSAKCPEPAPAPAPAPGAAASAVPAASAPR